MDIETITKLLDAGYTKAEIDAMQAGHDAGGETDKGAGEENPKTSEEQSTTKPEGAQIAQGVEIGAAIEALTNTVAGLKETVKALQDKNAAGASVEQAHKDTVEDVMKSFIDSL